MTRVSRRKVSTILVIVTYISSLFDSWLDLSYDIKFMFESMSDLLVVTYFLSTNGIGFKLSTRLKQNLADGYVHVVWYIDTFRPFNQVENPTHKCKGKRKIGEIRIQKRVWKKGSKVV